MNVHSTINLYRHTSCERQIARSSRDSVRKTWIHILSTGAVLSSCQ
jgi:hypothetical protein